MKLTTLSCNKLQDKYMLHDVSNPIKKQNMTNINTIDL